MTEAMEAGRVAAIRLGLEEGLRPTNAQGFEMVAEIERLQAALDRITGDSAAETIAAAIINRQSKSLSAPSVSSIAYRVLWDLRALADTPKKVPACS